MTSIIQSGGMGEVIRLVSRASRLIRAARAIYDHAVPPADPVTEQRDLLLAEHIIYIQPINYPTVPCGCISRRHPITMMHRSMRWLKDWSMLGAPWFAA